MDGSLTLPKRAGLMPMGGGLKILFFETLPMVLCWITPLLMHNQPAAWGGKVWRIMQLQDGIRPEHRKGRD